MTRRMLGIALLAASVLLAPRPANAQRLLSSPDTLAQLRTVGDTATAVLWVEDVSATTDRLLVHNRTAGVVHVRSYQLTNCVGLLLPQCRTHVLGVDIAPHATITVAEIRSRSTRQNGYSYRIAVDLSARDAPAGRLYGVVGS